MDFTDRRKLGRVLGIGIVATALLLLAISVFQVEHHPRTDDGTVRANSIAFAPEVEGRLVKLLVQDNQQVHKGDLLFEIDQRPYDMHLGRRRLTRLRFEGQINDAQRRIATERSAVGTAQAGVLGSQGSISAAKASYQAAQAAVERSAAAKTSADAQLQFAQNDYARIAPLLSKHYVTTQQVDQAQTSVRVAQEASRQAASQLLQTQAQQSMALAARQTAEAGLQASQSKLGEAQHTVDTLETLLAQRTALRRWSKLR
jgi:multidrug efflux system membrane fusion protein